MPKAQKPEFTAQKWNKKKIILTALAVAFLIVAALQLKNYILGDAKGETSAESSSGPSQAVEGAKISPTISLPTAKQIGESLGQNLNDIKQELNNINVQDIATSSPQVKKILEDIKALPNYPANQAKDVCLNICNSL